MKVPVALRFVVAIAVALHAAAARVTAESIAATRPASTYSSTAVELPPEVGEALRAMEDFVFHVDQSGFFALIEYVKHESGATSLSEEDALFVSEWRDVLMRPGDFRGARIRVTGKVGRNKDPWTLRQRPDLGKLYQIELERPDQPVSCTVICTEDVSDIPRGARIEVIGYFLMVRNYYTSNRNIRQSLLLIASGPTAILQIASPPPPPIFQALTWIVSAAVLGLIVVWVILRRAARGVPPDLHSLRASRTAPVSLSGELDALADSIEHDFSADESPRNSREPGP